MAEDRDSGDRDTPSLEPPSLFRRKKRPKQPESPPTPTSPPPPVEDDAPTTILDEPADTTVQPPVTPAAIAEAAPVRRPRVPRAPAPTVAPPVAPPAPAVEPALATPEPPPEPPSEPGEPREPMLTAPVAVVLAGLLVGLLVVGSTAGSVQLCSAVRGTSTCGGAGVFLILAILVVGVLVGTAVLRAAQVPEAGGTSFLAVGLLTVVALLFLTDQLFAWWMVLVIPVVALLTFLLSWWITTTYVDTGDAAPPTETDRPTSYDVR